MDRIINKMVYFIIKLGPVNKKDRMNSSVPYKDPMFNNMNTLWIKTGLLKRNINGWFYDCFFCEKTYIYEISSKEA